MAIGWKPVPSDAPPGTVVRPNERLSWPKTIGIGAQHVVAMFGATFVFPLIMGLDANLAIMMCGVCTILFLLIVEREGAVLPGHLGVLRRAPWRRSGPAAATARRSPAPSWSPALTLAVVGILVHFVGARALRTVLPPVVSGAVVMLIGFNLAPVVAGTYWPQDQGVAIVVMLFTIVAAVAFRGFWSRIAVFLALIFGYLLSWVLDKTVGMITSPNGAGDVSTHYRVNLDGVGQADWFGLPTVPRPELPGQLHPAGAARRDRADRREHRPRPRGRRDDRRQPRPVHGPGAGRGRHRHRALVGHRRLADHHLRREHRRDGGDEGLLDGGLLGGGDRGHPARAWCPSSAPSSTPPPAACSAASPSCSTA